MKLWVQYEWGWEGRKERFISSISEVTGDAVTWRDAEEAVKNIVHKDNMKGHLESSFLKRLFIWKAIIRTGKCHRRC